MFKLGNYLIPLGMRLQATIASATIQISNNKDTEPIPTNNHRSWPIQL
eukprot:COSAG02_NODE_57050_length_282_cov_0.846995_1_plen_47_part_01